MSHYSVCVVIPHEAFDGDFSYAGIEYALESIMAPYDEGTEDARFAEFCDRTEEAKENYANEKIRAIRFPDGHMVPMFSHEFTDKYMFAEDTIFEKDPEDSSKRIESDAAKALKVVEDQPISAFYTFPRYCSDYCGYIKGKGGTWGCISNPNAEWDWYDIGGRFPGEFLTRSDNNQVLPVRKDEVVPDAPRGYRYVNAARMKDIAWDKIRELKVEAVKTGYERLKKAFEAKDSTELPTYAQITEDGIAGWCEMLFRKGETLEQYMSDRGATEADQYPIDTYAFIDRDGEWHAHGEMGWFGVSMNEKPAREWRDELVGQSKLIDPEDVLVCVDCHI